MTIVDFAWQRPTPAQLCDAGVTGVIRYLSHDPAKNLTPGELAGYTTHQIAVALVWETTTGRALDGYQAGIDDATEAERQRAALGIPDDRPVYFAVDQDVTAGQAIAISAGYLAGAQSVLGSTAGVYGGYTMVTAAWNAQVHWTWQTDAWSDGQWFSGTDLRQSGQEYIGGIQVDLNTAQDSDWGQHPAPGTIASPAPAWPGRYLEYTPGDPDMLGNDVSTWQRQMAHRGWVDANGNPLTVDGDYGPQSARVCELFQQEKGLVPDSIVGPRTWNATWTAPIT